ncbi:UDP-3-O-acyl-N-acetylglucosamine deacetylase [Frankliniella fusca]|uniref:UDP-3-O-acyl-N-acetylglucosamine deacetylase n=1 Tax=Frankliniella fusca TaxID=407009 RepID=A0AAE1GQY1_9NEOP|nr:UDP-3-O-acyl-N-acetylglucosamine deacetylase [Frankliniella fusca]
MSVALIKVTCVSFKVTHISPFKLTHVSPSKATQMSLLTESQMSPFTATSNFVAKKGNIQYCQLEKLSFYK